MAARKILQSPYQIDWYVVRKKGEMSSAYGNRQIERFEQTFS